MGCFFDTDEACSQDTSSAAWEETCTHLFLVARKLFRRSYPVDPVISSSLQVSPAQCTACPSSKGAVGVVIAGDLIIGRVAINVRLRSRASQKVK